MPPVRVEESNKLSARKPFRRALIFCKNNTGLNQKTCKQFIEAIDHLKKKTLKVSSLVLKRFLSYLQSHERCETAVDPQKQVLSASVFSLEKATQKFDQSKLGFFFSSIMFKSTQFLFGDIIKLKFEMCVILISTYTNVMEKSFLYSQIGEKL